ncbi:lateral suppressor protein, partial [Genlisea aurea]
SSQDYDKEGHAPPRPGVYLHSPPGTHMRQLLITAAEMISRSDFTAASRMLTLLSASSSPYGDSTERLVHQFTKALTLRLAGPGFFRVPTSVNPTAARDLQSSYLALNQVTPFIRFSQLTANQAILETIEGQHAIHIVDFDIMHGVQWPPLMQALAEKFPPPSLRITGTGSDLDILRRTGDRLAKFAHSLGLRFQFNPLIIRDDEQNPQIIFSSPAIILSPEETLAVNFNHYLHRHLRDRDALRLFLRRIKSLGPAIISLAEREANHNHPIFHHRFVEALNHYGVVFDSLEATLPPNSHDRYAVEQIWFGKEIADIVAAEGEVRRERHERFRSWDLMMRSCGFNNVALSPFAVSQAKLLLRLHYPSEGYQLHVFNDSLFLGWQNQPLFSVSSW